MANGGVYCVTCHGNFADLEIGLRDSFVLLLLIRDWSLITGRRTTKGGGQVVFYPFKKKGGGAHKVLR